MNLLWLLVVILVLFAIFGSPTMGIWNHGYGWGPSGIGGVIVLVLVILLLTGRL